MKKTILALCAHNDDQIIGAGGTLIKYAKEGYNLITVIFSHGETSLPLEKDEITIQTRISEAEESDKILGGKRLIFLGLKDGKITEEIDKKKIKKRVVKIIRELKPEKIFTHSSDDTHPDHRTVYQLVKSLIDDKMIKCDVYSFEIWTLIKMKNRDKPKMVVDVTNTFKQKIRAFKAHKSQKSTIITLLWNIYLQAMLNGLNNDCKYAEVFEKIN